MVDSSINSPNVDPKAYPTLLETIQSLGKEYQSFDECSSNLRRPTGLSVIPGIHVPLQVDDSACKGVSFNQGDFDQEDRAERAAAGAQASTSTSSDGPLNTSGGPPNMSGAGGENALPRDIDIIPPLPSGLGPMSYNNFYGDGPRGFIEEFWVKYSILDDVLVERVTTDRISFGDGFIILPLFVITGGNNLSFTLGDLMLMYMVSRNPKYDKYYLTTHQHFDHLVDRLYDTEKWGNVWSKYLATSNGGQPTLSSTTPSQLEWVWRWRSPIESLECEGSPALGTNLVLVSVAAFRFVLTSCFPYIILTFHLLLSTEQGALYHRQVALSDCLATVCQSRHSDPPRHYKCNTWPKIFLPRGYRNGRSNRNPSPPTDRSNRISFLLMLLLRNPTPVAEERGTRPPRGRIKGPRKRPKLLRMWRSSQLASPKMILPTRNESSALFVSDFECSDGHVITISDSLEESPLLAMTLLKGLALLKDMENLPTGKAKNMAELCLFLANCASKAFGDMDVLLKTKRPFRGGLQAKRKEAEQFANQIEELEAKVAEAKTVRQERDRLLLRIKDAEAENDQLKEEKEQMEEDLPRKLEEAGDAGYYEAGEYY
ncbi:hypothetical protein RHSIM_Rhsim07G0158000 [Rhododendron simsii]|uniref:Uncharacterized protein n=1 Tax=Rhododendron simsii TaxID=118357 RepID=A0A834GQZ0_RHOSS|nr:hypothetical protein RHSIM_Rhsim07G0158000 [Rhododendron simsii]